jgi:hypothetical protein
MSPKCHERTSEEGWRVRSSAPLPQQDVAAKKIARSPHNPSPVTQAVASLLGRSRADPFLPFLEYVELAARLIEGDGNVDSLDYRDRLHRWCFG